jgi:hypothetical protein
MSDACAIYSPKVDYSILAVVQELLPGSKVELEGTEAAWSAATVSRGASQLQLHSLSRSTGGDKFLRILEGTSAFLRQRGAKPAELEELGDFLAKVEWLVGVVAVPALQGELLDCVNALEKRLGGRVFQNEAFRSA